MAKRPTLTDITSLTNSSAINALSENWDAIEEAFDNTLSLDGSTPNALNADLDLNGNALLNVGTIDVENLTLDGQTITDVTAVPEWRSSWVTTTAYAKRDMVKTAGDVYICLVAHTSGTFATDLTAVKWELMVSKGDSGAGTGDMLGANNLSDLADDATARSNLGLGSAATENTVPVGKGGTGATDEATARGNLGLGDLALEDEIDTTLFSAATLVTEADGISSNDNDTTIPTSAAVKAYVDSFTSQPILLETLTMTGTSVTMAERFSTGKSYLFEMESIGHNNAASRILSVAFYGETSAAFSTAQPTGEGFVNTDLYYATQTLWFPKRTQKFFTLSGINYATTTAVGTNSGTNYTTGRLGAMHKWGTAQSVSHVRFTLDGAGTFTGGTIKIWEF